MEIIGKVKWDFGPNDKIEYFDPSCSYFITKYRPITETLGLDFDPTPFCEVGQTKLKTGRYTVQLYGKLLRDFWLEQHRRCKEGFEANGYRITGDHYFFLNFYPLQLVQNVQVTGSGRNTEFPSFITLQYEYFHYIEIAESLKLDVITLKSRGVGWSEILALMGSSRYTTTKKYVSIYTAFYEDYLLGTGGVVTKCWDNLEFLNTETDGGMKRLRQSVNTTYRKRLSILDKDKTERGHMSEISLIITDKPRKLRGSRVDRLFFEELGSNEHSIKLWIQSLALVSVQGKKFGTRLGWGCLTLGNKVYNGKGELVNIEELNPLDGILGFNKQTGVVEKQEIPHMENVGLKTCYRITTNTGRSLSCSHDHPFLTYIPNNYTSKDYLKNLISNKYLFSVAANKLKIGDRVAIAKEIPFWGIERMWNPRLIGILIGDGSYGHNATVQLLNCDEGILNYVESNFKTHVTKSYTTKLNKTMKYMNIKEIRPHLRELGIINQIGINKTLPKNIHKYCKEDICDLLAGLFDTDGYVSHRKIRNKFKVEISLCGQSELLLNEVRFLLQKLGIHGGMRKRMPRIRPQHQIQDKNPWYEFTICDRDSLMNFYENITLLTEEKQRRINLIPELYKDVKQHISNSLNGVVIERVKEVEYLGALPIFNLTASPHHNYLANGLITIQTGGDSGPQLLGLEKMFFNPTEYNILPYKHNCTKNGEWVISLYFVPLYACLAGFIDARGVTNKTEAKAYFEKERNKLVSNMEDYLINCLEYCFTPEELLSRQGVNSFNQIKLAEQRLEIELHKTTPVPERGNLEWVYNSDNDIIGVRWEKSLSGKILIMEKPLKDLENNPIRNLYVAGIDSIDQGVTDSVVGEKGSKFCITVKKRLLGNSGNQYVCLYLDRPPVAKEAYAVALKILWWYGCKANLEDTKITLRLYLRERKWDNKMLMKRPQYGLSDPGQKFRKNTSNLWGTPGSTKMIEHGLELVTDYIEDYCHQIFFLEMIEQLQRYSYENKGLFDIVAAMIMTEIGDEDMFNTKIKDMTATTTIRRDVGWYEDSTGKHWGIIPDKNSNNNIKICVPQIWRVN